MNKDYNSNILRYRPDIDGLRAIAVFFVIIYHSFPSIIKSGFIGVDIFFVISGFLISTNIIRSLETNSFSFIDFYRRRVRRIFPALITVLLGCFVFCWFFFTPDEYQQLGKYIAGATVFISNYISFNESGYFDLAAIKKPLLHIWSLGIEEQFYIGMPLFLWFLWTLKKEMRFFLIFLIFIISFSLNIYLVKTDPIPTFYLLQTRFWELMSGVILAYYKFLRGRLKIRLSGKIIEVSEANMFNIHSLLGILILAAGLKYINNQVLYPGWWALFPVIGTVLVISAGSSAWINRNILSNQILVFVGLVSYPLYLWHWPLLAIAYAFEPILSIKARLVIICLTFLLAFLTYKFIELPVRFGISKIKTIILVGLMGVLGLVGYQCFLHDGFDFIRANMLNSMKKGDIGHTQFRKYLSAHFYSCPQKLIDNIGDSKFKRNLGTSEDVCLQSKKQSPIQIILLGDSHAEHLLIGLAKKLEHTNIGAIRIKSTPYFRNNNFTRIFDYVISDKNITTVILSANWITKMKNEERDIDFRKEMLLTVTKLVEANKKVFIAQDNPDFPFDIARCKILRGVRALDFKCSFVLSESEKSENNVLFRDFNYITEKLPKVQILKIMDYFCKDAICSIEKNGFILFRDTNHLNIPGSIYVGEKIIQDYPGISF